MLKQKKYICNTDGCGVLIHKYFSLNRNYVKMTRWSRTNIV